MYIYFGIQLQKIVPSIAFEYTSNSTSLLFVIRLQKLIPHNTFELFLSSNIASILFSEVFFLSGAYREKKEKKRKSSSKGIVVQQTLFHSV